MARAGLSECFDLNAIGPGQADVAERGRQLFGVEKFGRVAEVHRSARIDQGVEVQVFFLEEQFEDEFFEPGVKIPVQEPQVVARRVVAKVGEFDALSAAPAAALAFHSSAKNFPRDQFEPFELPEQFGREKFCVRRWHGGSGDRDQETV